MSSSDAERLTPDGIFELLSNHRRRMVLYHLRQRGVPVEVTELAEEIAAMENEVSVEELTSQQRKRVYVSLYQTHLPKMAEMNAIDYDKEEGIVQLADQASDIDDYLTTEERQPYPWVFHYLVLTAVGAAALTLAELGAPVLGAVPLLWIGIGVLALFAVSAGVQYWRTRNREESLPLELDQHDE
jgi:hypothetical protein